MNAEAGDRPRTWRSSWTATPAGPRARGLSITEGHRAGTDTLKRTVDIAGDLGIEQLTVYAFSTENWARPDAEVSGIMSLFVERLRREAPELDERGVRLRIIGRRDRVSEQRARADRVGGGAHGAPHASERCSSRSTTAGARRSCTPPRHTAEAAEEEFRKHLYAPDLKDPQLIIRTGGELRLSNFLLWESAYSELYFSEKMWPDFDREEFERAVSSYGSREYRFGGR